MRVNIRMSMIWGTLLLVSRLRGRRAFIGSGVPVAGFSSLLVVFIKFSEAWAQMHLLLAAILVCIFS